MIFPPLWSLSLQDASFRGVPFVVTQSELTRGRRVAVHEYPFRDVPYIEDLGRSRQEIPFTGFLVGDDVYAQRDRLAAVCDQRGVGTLIHPSLGSVQANLISASFGERAEDGRMIAINLRFIIAGPILFPSLYPLVGQNSLQPKPQGALNTVVSAIKDFAAKVTNFIDKAVSAVKAFIAPIIAAVGAVAAALAPFAGLIMAGVGMAFAAMSAVKGVSIGQPNLNLGRYSQGNLAPPRTAPGTVIQASASALDAATAIGISNACSARTTVVNALANVNTLASASDPAFGQALADMIETVRTAIRDPNDQLCALVPLAKFVPPTPIESTSPIGMGIAAATIATGALCRRVVLASIANAVAEYQPISSTQTNEMLEYITPLFDAEITFAADAGDLASYRDLRALRTAVVSDLQTRGSQLPSLITITRQRSLPALVLAQQLYRDGNRSDELTSQIDPANPLFCPMQFEALSA